MRLIRPFFIKDKPHSTLAHKISFNEFIVNILWSAGGHSEEERWLAAQYAQAGATWWLEDISTECFSTLKEVRHRLNKGPPG